MELLSCSDAVLVEKSVQIIFSLLQLFGSQRLPEQRLLYFIEEHMRHLADAVKTTKTQIKKKALKCIIFALDQEDHQLSLTDDQKNAILKVVKPLVNGDKCIL